ncbi:MAG: hypothetical protein XD54_1945, partial [Thermococcus sibiricus]
MESMLQLRLTGFSLKNLSPEQNPSKKENQGNKPVPART